MVNTNNSGRVMHMVAVSPLSYRMYAKRYGIRLTKMEGNTRKYRRSKEFKNDIYYYEKRNRPKNGMYF